MTRKKQHMLFHIRDRLSIVYLPFVLVVAVMMLAAGGSVAASLHRTESIGTVTGKEVKNSNNKGIYRQIAKKTPFALADGMNLLKFF